MKRQVISLITCVWYITGFASVQPVVQNPGHQVIISEFMAFNNSTVADEDGFFSDWVELFNPSSDTISLNGYFLTDDASNLVKWSFPDRDMAPGEFLLVFLSGKIKDNSTGEIHVGFKLDAGGEPLILVKPDRQTKIWYFENAYPEQYSDVSYALTDSVYTYTKSTTPGKVNKQSVYLPKPGFSLSHGFYSNPIDVEITSPVNSGEIYYTLDGTSPVDGNRIKYTAPLHFDSTALLRAVIMDEGVDTGISVSASYIYLQHVIRQPVVPKGYPELWGPNTAFPGYARGDYEMDPDVVNSPEYKDSMVLSLMSIPTISIVTNKDHLFLDTIDDELGGIYIYTGPPINDEISGIGKDWQRPASVEYIIPGSDKGFQVNCGIQLNGGHSRRPEKCPKHSFRLLFKSEYGPTRFDYNMFPQTEAVKSFNRLILRGGFNNTWNHSDRGQRNRAQFIHDSWAKDTQRAMGHVSAHNKFAHLYINGLYWGLYNISERLDDEFMQSYFGGDETDYDIIKDYTEPLRGTLDAWNRMGELLDAGVEDDATYQKLLGNNPDGTPNAAYEVYVDPVSLIDYMLINFYGGNSDWDHHNWVAARNRVDPGTGFKFFIWDGEHIFERLDDDYTSMYNYNCPSWVYASMLKNENFKKLLQGRIALHFYNNGVLTPRSAMERWVERAKEVRLAVMAESARWGDYRSPFNPYTLHEDWNDEYLDLMSAYFPERTRKVIEQFKTNGLYPNPGAPVFSHQGGNVEMGYGLGMSVEKGTIFYTTNGADPMNEDGSYNDSSLVYVPGSVVINSKVTIKARTQYAMEWSTITQGTFTPVQTTGVIGHETIKMEQISIYPNPASETAYIEYYLNGNNYINMSVYNTSGIRVKGMDIGYQGHGWQSVALNVDEFSNGVYYLVINNGALVDKRRFIVKK